MKRATKKEKAVFILILDEWLKTENIRVIRWSSSSSGSAYQEDKHIRIPKPTNLDRFYICMHEVGHIIHYKKSDPIWMAEWRADKFAMSIFDEYLFDKSRVIIRTQRHMLMVIAKAANRGFSLDKLPDDLLEFLEYDFDVWKIAQSKNQSIYVDYDGPDSYKNPLRIMYTERVLGPFGY